MQLAHAIDAWVQAHGASLSVSTQRDIQHIRAAVVEVGWQELPCEDVDDEVREEIIEEATRTGTLGGSAISEFFNVVLHWRANQPDIPLSSDGESQLELGDGLGPSGAFHRDGESNDDAAVDDESTDADDVDDEDQSSDADKPDDDESAVDDVDDEDQSSDDADADDDESEDDDDSSDDDDDDESEDDEEWDEEDDDDESDDDDDDESEDDEEWDEEDDDEDEDDPDDNPEDWVSYLGTAQDGDDFTGLQPENETSDDPATEKAAASSFFNAIESLPPIEDPELAVVIEEDTTTKDKGGVFSAAAEQIPPKPASGIDWITVAYFTVAAICFVLVIYFYLTSS